MAKSIDLKGRLILYHAENRVRAHMSSCMLAYHVDYRMRDTLSGGPGSSSLSVSSLGLAASSAAFPGGTIDP